MEEKETIYNGETEVQIASIGTVIGSDKDGNPVEQNFTEDSLQKIADNLNTAEAELLVDKDHNSMKPFAERDTTAMGYAKKFEMKKGKGLFSKIFWTDIGKKLIDNRVFRFISPVFKLDKETKEPTELVNMALTNMPSQKTLDPILNSIPLENKETKDIVKMEMTKEELVELIKTTFAELQKPVEETKTEEVVAEDAEPEETKETACNETTETVEETKTEVKEEVPAKEEVKEVIQEEALNSAPTIGVDITGEAAWKNLHGNAFWKYIKEHPECR